MAPRSRRSFLQASAAAAASAALGEAGAFARRPDRPNVLLVIVDSLRADAVYERGVRTPNMDALARQGLRFTNAFPEAMPTVPARNSILSGRRMFPFRGWHDHRGLIAAPGWSPLRNVDQALPAVLRRAGYWTAYVTDNPFLGFSAPYAPLRRSVHRFVRTGGQIGGGKPVSSVPQRVLDHWLHPSLRGDPRNRQRVGLYLANSRSWEDPAKSYAGRVFRDALERARHGGAAAALRHDRRHLRATRAVDPAGPLAQALRARLARPGARDAELRAGEQLAGAPPSAGRSWGACATSTRPR